MIVDSRKGFTQILFGPTFRYAVASFFKEKEGGEEEEGERRKERVMKRKGTRENE